MESKRVTRPVPPLFLSITLHLKITCPPSPVHSQTSLVPGDPPRQPVPQVSIQVESDAEESDFYPEQKLRPPDDPPPPGTYRDSRQKRRAHFDDDSSAETVL